MTDFCQILRALALQVTVDSPAEGELCLSGGLFWSEPFFPCILHLVRACITFTAMACDLVKPSLEAWSFEFRFD